MKTNQLRAGMILSILSGKVAAPISELASEIGVSDMTIRRDLQALSQTGYVTVIHGVAILNSNQDGSKISMNYSIAEERHRLAENKNVIGMEACKLIEANDIILIDCGSTTECMLPYLNTGFPFTVVSYALNILAACREKSNISLIAVGGFCRKNTELLDSPEGIELLSRLNINKCFMAASGITAKGNVSCAEHYEFPYKTGAIRSSASRILLVDSTKFSTMRPCLFASLEDFDLVITDRYLSEEGLNLLEKSSVKYILA